MSINQVIDWKPAFLAALRELPVVVQGCEAVGVSRTAVYRAREADPAFAADWDDALETGIDRLEREAVRRAMVGYDEPVIHKGQITPVFVEERDAEGNVVLNELTQTPSMVPLKDSRGAHVPLTVRKYSDPLLALLLKGRRKAVFSERIEQTGANGAPLIPADEGARALRAAALLALAERRRQATDDACDLC